MYAQAQAQTAKKATTTNRNSNPNPSPKPERDPHEERRKEEQARRAELKKLEDGFGDFCTKADYNPPQIPMSAVSRLAFDFKKKSEWDRETSTRKWAWAAFLENISRKTKPLMNFRQRICDSMNHVPMLRWLFGNKVNVPKVEMLQSENLDNFFDPNLNYKQIEAHQRHEHMVAELSEKTGLENLGSMTIFRNHFNGSGVIQMCFPKFGSILIRLESPLDPTEVAHEYLARFKRAFGKILGTSTPISILNGDLRGVNFKSLFPGKPMVGASKTEDQALVKARIHSSATRKPIVPESSAVISGLPQTPKELSNLFPRDEEQSLNDGAPSWAVWRDQYPSWRKSVNATGFSFSEETHTSQLMLDALCERQDVIVLVAHASSDKLFFPDGTQVSTEDILERKDAISLVQPAVYLFCCETAKIDEGAKNVVEALLEAGASSVTAPQLRINADSSRQLCEKFLTFAKSSTPIEAFAAAEAKTRNTDLETWIA